MRSSAIYETEPVGCEKGAAKFLNAAIEFDYAHAPHELLNALARIEKLLGRAGDHRRNVSRTIDLDLLYFGDQIVSTGDLELPHPRIAGREFVLRPLADICPDRVLPEQTESIVELLRALGPSPAVVRADLEW
jgi:2-amino-4-hydroxy-6-hydroxymethyldihydropteridine diphosphokinase